MYARTKKVGSVGRYGPRIGGKIRREVRKIEDKAKQNRCTSCGKKVKRIASGIWECRFCGSTFTGGAYYTVTKKKATSISKPELEKVEITPKEEKVKKAAAKKKTDEAAPATEEETAPVEDVEEAAKEEETSATEDAHDEETVPVEDVKEETVPAPDEAAPEEEAVPEQEVEASQPEESESKTKDKSK